MRLKHLAVVVTFAVTVVSMSDVAAADGAVLLGGGAGRSQMTANGVAADCDMPIDRL